jgi:uncharacterized protein with HEPN domain
MSNKKKRDLELFIVDIFVATLKIKEYTSTFDNPHDFQSSSLHWDATIRQLEIIGEALNNLLANDKFNSIAPKYFRKVVNFRNNIVHGYFGIDIDEVWDVITSKLDILKSDLNSIVESHIDISGAIICEIDEYKALNDIKTVEYLNSFLKD